MFDRPTRGRNMATVGDVGSPVIRYRAQSHGDHVESLAVWVGMSDPHLPGIQHFRSWIEKFFKPEIDQNVVGCTGAPNPILKGCQWAKTWIRLAVVHHFGQRTRPGVRLI